MPLSAQILAGIAAALHVLFFYLESVAWSKPPTWKTFGIASQADADVIRPMALNQGFYNLFLAIAIAVGIVFLHVNDDKRGWTTYAPLSDDQYSLPFPYASYGSAAIVTSLAVMLAAALVLLISSKGKLARGAAIQGLVPLVALIIIVVS
jgi:putative membrane protein